MKKIRVTKAKHSLRYKGIGLTAVDEILVLTVNEIIDELRIIKKQLKATK